MQEEDAEWVSYWGSIGLGALVGMLGAYFLVDVPGDVVAFFGVLGVIVTHLVARRLLGESAE